MASQNKKESSCAVAVVDNDPYILDSIKMVFEEEGWKVLTYRSGEEFLSDLYNRDFECLLLEPNLPGINGAEIIRQLDEANCHARVVGLTARPYGERTRALKNSGVEDILVKPVSERLLLQTVRKALNQPPRVLH